MVFVKDSVHSLPFNFSFFIFLPTSWFLPNGGVSITELKIRDYQNICYTFLLYFPVRTEDLGTPPKRCCSQIKLLASAPMYYLVWTLEFQDVFGRTWRIFVSLI